VSEAVIRDAVEADLPQVVAIQNALLATTTIEWRDEPHTVAERRVWLADHQSAGHPVLVAVEGEQVLGFATYGEFRDIAKWPGYRYVVEHTVHVRDDQWGSGVGRRLVEALAERARADGIRAIVAAVDGSNEDSVRFHERVGFVEVGRLPRIGFKHDRWLDLVLLQRDLGD
jgi:phosphinothricin acetyltransferase